jgi:hypothetical protein
VFCLTIWARGIPFYYLCTCWYVNVWESLGPRPRTFLFKGKRFNPLPLPHSWRGGGCCCNSGPQCLGLRPPRCMFFFIIYSCSDLKRHHHSWVFSAAYKVKYKFFTLDVCQCMYKLLQIARARTLAIFLENSAFAFLKQNSWWVQMIKFRTHDFQ